MDFFWLYLVGGFVAFLALLWAILAVFCGPGLDAIASGATEIEEDEDD